MKHEICGSCPKIEACEPIMDQITSCSGWVKEPEAEEVHLCDSCSHNVERCMGVQIEYGKIYGRTVVSCSGYEKETEIPTEHLCSSCFNQPEDCGQHASMKFSADLKKVLKCSGYRGEQKVETLTSKTEIKDTGNRRAFSTGAVRDIAVGKGRYDLLPWDAIHEFAMHCEQGAIKYGERNCEKGIPMHSLIDSAIRHLSCYLRGMKDEPHLRAALWNIGFAIYTEKHHPEMQDIPVRMVE